MNDIDHNQSKQNSSESASEAPRRRFVRGVGVAVPAVLTVWSSSARSTMSSKTCLSPSATASINLLNSRPKRKQDDCIGRTPGYWMNANSAIPDQHKWSEIGSSSGGILDTMKLRQVMKLTGNQDQWQLGAHLSAAYCNLLMGWVPQSVLSLKDLQDMWAGRYGTYVPTPGVQWGGEKIVTYLKSTMPL